MKNKFFIAVITTLVFVFCLTAATCNTATGEIEPEIDIPQVNIYENDYDIGEIQPFDDISAAELVDKIRVGWNLGNTLDAAGGETAWGNPVTKKSNIDEIKSAGFNAIRIPVSWTNGVNSNYDINKGWMKRVNEIVDYAAANDMYIILNTHHDEAIFKLRDRDIEKTKKVFQKVWTQIAYVFQNYNEKLILEDLNEPRTKGSSAEWQGGTGEERKNLNALHQIFVDTVRASGGNNDKRILMVSTYAASAEQSALSGLTIPNDPAKSKIIVSVHTYSPYFFALHEGAGSVNKWSKNSSSDISDVRTPIDRISNTFVSKGYPVILGEFGSLNRNNEDARAEHAEYYVSYAKSKGMKCIWWDDGGNFQIFNRNSNTFRFPKIRDALMKGSE